MANKAKFTSSASFALLVLFAINLLNFFDRQLPGALAEPIRKEFHLSGTALWSLLTGASGLAQSYMQLFVSRLGVGLGEAACAPAGQSLIGDLYPPHQRARAMGIFMLGLPAGLCLAYFSAGRPAPPPLRPSRRFAPY